MMKSFSAILISLFCSILCAQKNNINLCRWHLNDKVEMSDFRQIKKAKIFYSLSNDNDNIYVGLMVDDRDVQSTILNQGLTLWISMDEKPRKQKGVMFPMGYENKPASGENDLSARNSAADESTASLVASATTIELKGFTEETERHIPSENSDNFRGSVRYNRSGAMFYRMVMPISKLPLRNSKNGRGAMPFALGIEYGGNSVSFKNNNQIPSKSELYWIKGITLATSR